MMPSLGASSGEIVGSSASTSSKRSNGKYRNRQQVDGLSVTTRPSWEREFLKRMGRAVVIHTNMSSAQSQHQQKRKKYAYYHRSKRKSSISSKSCVSPRGSNKGAAVGLKAGEGSEPNRGAGDEANSPTAASNKQPRHLRYSVLNDQSPPTSDEEAGSSVSALPGAVHHKILSLRRHLSARSMTTATTTASTTAGSSPGRMARANSISNGGKKSPTASAASTATCSSSVGDLDHPQRRQQQLPRHLRYAALQEGSTSTSSGDERSTQSLPTTSRRSMSQSQLLKRTPSDTLSVKSATEIVSSVCASFGESVRLRRQRSQPQNHSRRQHQVTSKGASSGEGLQQQLPLFARLSKRLRPEQYSVENDTKDLGEGVMVHLSNEGDRVGTPCSRAHATIHRAQRILTQECASQCMRSIPEPVVVVKRSFMLESSTRSQSLSTSSNRSANTIRPSPKRSFLLGASSTYASADAFHESIDSIALDDEEFFSCVQQQRDNDEVERQFPEDVLIDPGQLVSVHGDPDDIRAFASCDTANLWLADGDFPSEVALGGPHTVLMQIGRADGLQNARCLNNTEDECRDPREEVQFSEAEENRDEVGAERSASGSTLGGGGLLQDYEEASLYFEIGLPQAGGPRRSPVLQVESMDASQQQAKDVRTSADIVALETERVSGAVPKSSAILAQSLHAPRRQDEAHPAEQQIVAWWSPQYEETNGLEEAGGSVESIYVDRILEPAHCEGLGNVWEAFGDEIESSMPPLAAFDNKEQPQATRRPPTANTITNASVTPRRPIQALLRMASTRTASSRLRRNWHRGQVDGEELDFSVVAILPTNGAASWRSKFGQRKPSRPLASSPVSSAVSVSSFSTALVRHNTTLSRCKVFCKAMKERMTEIMIRSSHAASNISVHHHMRHHLLVEYPSSNAFICAAAAAANSVCNSSIVDNYPGDRRIVRMSGARGGGGIAILPKARCRATVARTPPATRYKAFLAGGTFSFTSQGEIPPPNTRPHKANYYYSSCFGRQQKDRQLSQSHRLLPAHQYPPSELPQGSTNRAPSPPSAIDISPNQSNHAPAGDMLEVLPQSGLPDVSGKPAAVVTNQPGFGTAKPHAMIAAASSSLVDGGSPGDPAVEVGMPPAELPEVIVVMPPNLQQLPSLLDGEGNNILGNVGDDIDDDRHHTSTQLGLYLHSHHHQPLPHDPYFQDRIHQSLRHGRYSTNAIARPVGVLGADNPGDIMPVSSGHEDYFSLEPCNTVVSELSLSSVGREQNRARI